MLLWKGFGTLDSLPQQGTQPPKRWGWESFQIRGEIIDAHLLHGLVDQVLVPRVQNFLHGPWRDLIGGGRAYPGR